MTSPYLDQPQRSLDDMLHERDPFVFGGGAGDEPATAEQIAAFEFEPFSPEDVEGMIRDFSMPKWAEEFGQHGVALRLASMFLRLTKQEMVATVEDVERDFSGDGPGPTAEFIDCMRHARKRLSQLAK
jgi:hypothetical protein